MTVMHPIPRAGPAVRPAPAFARLLRRTGRRIAAAVKRLQYGQMVAALDRLRDDDLDAIGLRRPDIPARARFLIYGQE